MMVPRRVVIGRCRPKTLLVPKRESEAATRALDQLEALLKQPEPQTTLVLVAGADRQAQPDVQAAARSTRRSSSAAPSRIWPTPSGGSGTASRPAGAEIEPAAARLLAERAGTDVKRLRDDVDRLLLYALGQKRSRSTTCGRWPGRRRCRTTGR